jgi:uncharacterized protein (DUF433 family)
VGIVLKALRPLGGIIVEKKRVSAKDAAADIRAGMSDAAIMSKYALSNTGLQSLFDKLVNAGYIDLSEILERTPLFLGTVDVLEPIPEPEAVKAEDSGRPFKSRVATRVNAQEAARNVRAGMDDSALMEKYQLSPKGLQSLFKKLIEVRLLQQVDLERRSLGFEHTVVLSEDMLSLSGALKSLGVQRPTLATDKKPMAPQRIAQAPLSEEKIEIPALPEEERHASPNQAEPDYKPFDRPWYASISVIILLACFLLAIGCLIAAFLLPDRLLQRFL